ncbi:hypothetical protein [Rhizobium leguminosarum]|uniref:hypothetical protein n=1 Tax=Rhizobium leguminosarum TaxID=384 RepID=UPI000376ECF4|nr:hypothetical protein [Rhizobium leguminosarum]MBY5849644.1 hypothetical protein [Rhizobium leguminosarum]
MRSISDKDSGVIKAATAAAYEAMGGVSRAAEALLVGSSTLTKYASPNEEWKDSFIRLDLAIELDRRTGHPFLLEAMTKLVKNAPSKSFGALTASAVLRLDVVLDDVVREVVKAIENDHVDAAERLAVCERIVAAQAVLACLFAQMTGEA